jgi:hypothetical protein
VAASLPLARGAEIGALPECWNWLEGISSRQEISPSAVHFTRGIPSMPGYERVAFADEWRAELATTAHVEAIY